MPIEKLSIILKDAMQHQYGVAAFNVFNYESIKWVILAAQEERVPVIIQFYPGYEKHIPMRVVADITRELAKGVTIPIGLHLDHSNSYEQAVSGIKHGFQSIMMDGSLLPFEENIDVTKRVVEVAHVLDVEVEAELGHVGSGSNLDDYKNTSHYTKPKSALEFVQRAKPDSLAIAIGNGHGHYVTTPQIDFIRIEAIRRLVDVPLVMHGGSDIPDDQLQESIRLGISKFNIATEYSKAMLGALGATLMDITSFKGYMYGALRQCEESMITIIRKKIRTLNPNGYQL